MGPRTTPSVLSVKKLESTGTCPWPRPTGDRHAPADRSHCCRPHINSQYATVNGRRILSAVGRGYKVEVGRQLLVALAHSSHREILLRTLRSRYLALTIRFHFSSPLRRDVDGGVKITQDAVAEALGINDNRIVELHVYKSPGATMPRLRTPSFSSAASLTALLLPACA